MCVSVRRERAYSTQMSTESPKKYIRNVIHISQNYCFFFDCYLSCFPKKEVPEFRSMYITIFLLTDYWLQSAANIFINEKSTL